MTGCGALGTRTEFLTPKFTDAELTCARAPKGQLPPTATNGQVSDRIIDNDEAGEDCRQKLDRAKMKVQVFNEVVDQVNAHKKLKKKD